MCCRWLVISKRLQGTRYPQLTKETLLMMKCKTTLVQKTETSVSTNCIISWAKVTQFWFLSDFKDGCISIPIVNQLSLAFYGSQESNPRFSPRAHLEHMLLHICRKRFYSLFTEIDCVVLHECSRDEIEVGEEKLCRNNEKNDQIKHGIPWFRDWTKKSSAFQTTF